MADSNFQRPATAPTDDDVLFYGGPPLKIQSWLGLVRAGDPNVPRRAALVFVFTWLPLLALTASSSVEQLKSFLFDAGAHGRYLLVAPLLILAESICIPRLGGIIGRFVEAGIVTGDDRLRIRAAIVSTRRLLDSVWVEVITFVLAYALIATTVLSIHQIGIPAWHHVNGSPEGRPSAAGWWGLLVSLPILLVLLLGWLWRIFLWATLLWRISRMDLRLVASHPDRAAGLGFVSHSVLAFVPLSLAVGILFAGPVANKVWNAGAALSDYRVAALGAAALSACLFAGPLVVFLPRLTAARRIGQIEYGGLARRVGVEFEQTWLHRRIDASALDTPNFSATTDLYQVAANVREMRIVPVDIRTVAVLVGAALSPFFVVALGSMPFDVILKHLASALI